MKLGLDLRGRTSVLGMAWASVLACALSACGGGSGGGSPALPVAPQISQQPQATTIKDGGSASFSVVASGTGPLTYQWQANGTAIAGATSSTYTSPPEPISATGTSYSVVVTGPGGGVTSAAASLTVSPVAPTITQQPVATTITDGGSASFAVVAAGTGPLAYQWLLNGTAISGATASTYTTPARAFAASGTSYSVVVTGPGGTVTSATASLTVSAIAPTIDQQPASATVAMGGSVTFVAHASGSAPLTYQWLRGGVAVSGANQSTYTLSPATYGDNGTRFTVLVANAGGQSTSQAGTLTVTPPAGSTGIGSCQQITTSGSYLLQADLATTTSAPCISIHDTSDVMLDCAHHVLSDNLATPAAISGAIGVSNVQNFSIKNCTLLTTEIVLDRMVNGSLTGTTITFPPGSAGFTYSVINVTHSSRMTFDGNVISNGNYQQLYGQGNTISNNHMSSVSGAGTIILGWGGGSQVIANVLDGHWDGVRPYTMTFADDAVLLEDESNDSVIGNQISNYFDTGVELLGNIVSVNISQNTILNTGYSGVGGWYWLSISGMTLSNNSVTNAQFVFAFQRIYGLRPAGTDNDHVLPADTAVPFVNITISGNSFYSPYYPAGTTPTWSTFTPWSDLPGFNGGRVSSLAGEIPATPSVFTVGNIAFKNNNFGHVDAAPFLGAASPYPTGIFTDGGGNICNPPAAPVYVQSEIDAYPMKCN